ncbi:MAG: UDP-3-O-acyl-N-acetylglucosamine deacetylase [Moraxella sp.]|nr:UDP-3-O-acyl-N-acetylglucosamine deacetylase [Moraxella sp.]
MNDSHKPYVRQRTIAKPVTLTGIGLHSGQEVVLSLLPHDVDGGIVFVRTDLDNACVPMNAFLVQDTMMSSNLVQGDARVGTVEHVLSAVAAMGIDNLMIEVSSAEMPIMDGSAQDFVALIQQGGLREQSAPKKFIKILKPIKVTDGDKWASLAPAKTNAGFAMRFEIDFDHPAIAATEQVFAFELSSQGFIDEVAYARTFGFLKDLQALREHNLALGGSLDNAVVLDDDKVINPEGLRSQGEFVRHKTLDAIGDLYVIGHAIVGEFDAYKSGHGLNNRLIRAVLEDKNSHEIVTFYDKDVSPIDYQKADFLLD